VTLSEFARLFPEFRSPSRAAWRALFARITGDVREIILLLGRGAGKSISTALMLAYYATRDWHRAPGEQIYAGIFGPDRKQARVTFRYVAGLLHSVPALAALIESETQESISLSNGVIIEVITATRAAPRGRSYCFAAVEEAAFLPQGDSANPDKDLLIALGPALARVQGSVLAVVSSTYARRGITWEAEKKYGKTWPRTLKLKKGAPADVVYERAPTLAYNPTFDKRAIDKAYEEDPASAAAEYGSEFRTDVESYVSREVVDAAVVPGRHELPPVPGIIYEDFTDPAGGSGTDSFPLAIGHREGERFVLDAIRERRPPFSPEDVVTEFAALLRKYGCRKVTGDRYAGEWPREAFRKHGIEYEVSARPKSDLYRDALPLLNSGRLELLDHPRLIAQIAGLERRTARGGRDSIDHGPSGHDDVANVALGLAAVLAAGDQRPEALLLFTGRGADGSPGYIYEGDNSDLGLFEMNGVLTHALGDEFAQKILSGEVSREEALKITRRARRDLDAIHRRS
jgi:hypothetical protein